MKSFIHVALWIFLLASCAEQTDKTNNGQAELSKGISLNNDQQQHVASDNIFAFKLLQQINADYTEKKNLFLSPLSISLDLGMLLNGAQGNTKSEIEKALALVGTDSVAINTYYNTLLTQLPTVDPSTKLEIANSIWYKKNFQIKSTFVDANKNYFGATVQALDFSQYSALTTINNWCSTHTNGLIPRILDKIPAEAVVYITNAIYFKGIWRQKFDAKCTTQAIFTDENKLQSKVNMMVRTDNYNYTSTTMAQVIDLPYGNKAFSMTVLLPQNGYTLNEIIQSLTPASWEKTLNSLSDTKVEFHLPRLKLEDNYQLKETLQKLGINDAFQVNANLSGISNTNTVVSEVVHKSCITVDENGTEAAAITNTGVFTSSYPGYQVMCVDHPYLLIIRENSTGVILFTAKITNPAIY